MVVVVAAVVAATTISRTRGVEGTMMMAIRAAEGLLGADTKEGTKPHLPEVSSCAAVASAGSAGALHWTSNTKQRILQRINSKACRFLCVQWHVHSARSVNARRQPHWQWAKHQHLCPTSCAHPHNHITPGCFRTKSTTKPPSLLHGPCSCKCMH